MTGNFVFISLESRESSGKVYNNVNIEMVENGRILRVGVDDVALSKMQKYKEYIGFFDVGMYNREFFVRLLDVQVPTAPGK